MKIKKLGSVDYLIVETNPVVWKGRLLRLEYIRWQDDLNKIHTYPKNDYGNSYFRLVDNFTGEIVSDRIGMGLHMGNAFVWDDKMIVTCVENWGASRFYQLESNDLVHWSEPRVILEGDGWAGYNTTVCRADGRFIIMFELGAPKEIVGEPFTMFFAESRDLKEWKVIKDASLFKNIYTGAPLIRWFDGVFYAFYLNGSYDDGFEMYVARSRDLRNWEVSPKNPVLTYDDDDRLIYSSSKLSKEELELSKTAVNINVSDLDFCYFGGKLNIVYSWGNQRGTEFLALAEADATEQEFCESWF